MDLVATTLRTSRSACIALMLLLTSSLPYGPRVIGQSQSSPPTADLSERQREVRARVQRLESRMLELSRRLAQREPDKSERLDDGLAELGRKQLKTRMEELIARLRSQDFSDADQSQQDLLADLNALLELLTNPTNELDRRRQQRERLEKIKRSIRALMDEETQHLYRAQHAELQRNAGGEASNGKSPIAEMLRQLEQMQRETQRRASEQQRAMDASQGQNAAPGRDAMGKAAEQMRQAADRLGEMESGAAKQNQENALEEMQKALDELDDALRQVRREELEETLAALETRLRRLLERERAVAEVVAELESKGVSEWLRFDRQRLVETVKKQRQVEQDARQTLRIIVDEGSTVIVPELMKQMIVDMADVAARLERDDVAADTQRLLADIVELLEQILAAIASRREEMTEAESGAPPPQGQQASPLLPGSAELKLLRASQVRLNARWKDLQRRAQGAAGSDRIAQRQQRLAELARQMNERK